MTGKVVPFDRAMKLRLTLEWLSPDGVPNTLYLRTGRIMGGREWDVADGLIRDLTHEVREFRASDEEAGFGP